MGCVVILSDSSFMLTSDLQDNVAEHFVENRTPWWLSSCLRDIKCVVYDLEFMGAQYICLSRTYWNQK